jgi:uncharacterized protein
VFVGSAELIAEAGRRLATAAKQPAQVILFGSHARGEADERSDLDFLVIEPEVEDWMAESARLRRRLRGLPASFDVIVVSTDYADEWRNVYGTIVNAALNEGRILHG